MTDLVTTRLILRPWTELDVKAVVEGARQPSWAADFPAEGDTVIAGVLVENPLLLSPFGHRLIIERATDEVVGSLGLFWPPSEGRVEIGYGVVPSRQGRGYASEATAALTAFALRWDDVRAVQSHVEPSSAASARVLEKAGFSRYASTDEQISYQRTS
jgi:[ribosomal protein S5]-alanine N-acetyltransferase